MFKTLLETQMEIFLIVVMKELIKLELFSK